jgi:catechol 2,3-dioxygenase-like lactoylglutathione lyase family enzyme
MIDHTGIGVADVGRSTNFYDAALGALGMRRAAQIPENVVGTDGIGYGLDVLSFGPEGPVCGARGSAPAFAASPSAARASFSTQSW